VGIARRHPRRRVGPPGPAAGPGGVYLDLPAKLFAQSIDAAAGKNSLIKVVDPAPRQIPAPEAVKRALDLLKSAKKPLIILGKGAAYSQGRRDIKALVEKTAIPYLPMSMAKGCCRTHEQCASAAPLPLCCPRPT